MTQEIQWGILGPGRIARKLAAEWHLISGANLAGVASREHERALAFADEFSVDRVFDDYDSLLSDPNIDIVYVAVPHNFHRDLCLKAFAAGKAVFCEKPLGINALEASEMISAAKASGLFFMEAVKTRFMPAILKAQEWVRTGRIGAPGLLHAFFHFSVGDNVEGRHLNPELAGGALLDLGVYPLTLSEMLLGAAPIETMATGTLAVTGVDGTTAVTLRYADGSIAQLSVSVLKAAGTHARLWGESGYIDLPQFGQARHASLHVEDRVETFEQDGEGSFRFEVEEANRCLREGLLQSPGMSWEASLRMARWQDDILRQVKKEAS